jgi:parallel beta-helix repeat protein
MSGNKKLAMVIIAALIVSIVPIWPAGISHAATDYYVSPSGNDSNGGTLSAPFKTIQKCASLVTAGGTCYIRSGTYRETVTPTNSGTAGSPILFKPYNNESVTVTGADPISSTGWTVHSGSIYKTTGMNWTLGRGMDQLFVDGAMMKEARWPNATDLNKPVFKTVATTTTRNTSTKSVTFTDTANLTQSSGYWNGANLFMHIYNGFPQTGIITSYSTGTIQATMDTSPDYETSGGTKSYYIFGHLNALDTSTEFFRDSTGTLYLWMPDGGSPAGHTIEAKKREYAFNMTGRSYITLEDITIVAATVTTNSGFDYETPSTFAASAQHIVLDGVNAQYVSHFGTLVGGNMWVGRPFKHGLFLAGSNNTLQNSTVNWSAGNGVYIGDGANNRVLNNTISNVGYSMAGAAVDSGSSDEDDGSIDHANMFGEIAYNTIYNFGKVGISMSGIKGGSIHHNHLYNGLLQVADAGAIYGWNRDVNRLEVAYNKIHDMNAGVISGNKTGIYLDNRLRNAVVHHNLTYNVQRALILNMPGASFPKDGQYRYIYNNTFDATSLGMTYSPTGTADQDWGETYLKNNIFTKGFFPSDGNTKGVQQNNLYSGTNPLFVNAAAGNYTLQSTSSAINAGQALAGITDGYAGNAPDIGAFEYGQTPWTAGAGTMPSKPYQQVVFSPTEDSYVKQDAAGSNFDGEQRLHVKSSGTAARYSYIKFNVTGLTGEIKSAKLRIKESSTNAAGNTNFQLRKTTGAWSESTVTWNTRPTTEAISAGSFTLDIHGAAYDASIGESKVMDIVLDPAAVTGNAVYGFALLPVSGANENVYFSSEATDGPQLIIEYESTGTTPPDTTAPSAPSNLASPSKTSSSVALSWSASTDNVGVAGYDVYRGGSKVNTSLITATSYTDTGLSASTAYTYTIRAKDAAGNESASSSSLQVTTNASSGNRDAYSTIEAESYEAMSGITNTGTYIGSFDHNDWLRYDNVDFGSGASEINIHLAVPSAYAGQDIEIRLGSATGTLIGTLTAQSTGSFTSFATQSANVSGASGVQTVYLVAKGTSGIANIDAFFFSPATATVILEESFDSMTSGAAPAGWTNGGAVVANAATTVENTPSVSDKSMRLQDTTSAGSTSVYKTIAAQTGAFTAVWSFMETTLGTQFAIRNGTSSAVDLLTLSGNLYYKNSAGTAVLVQGISLNTWYTIKVVGDVGTDAYDIYVNGTLKVSGAPFRNAQTSLNQIFFSSSYGGSTTSYINEIKITSP